MQMTRKLFPALLALIACLSGPHTIALAQDEYRVVHLLYPSNCPVRIGVLKIAEKPIEAQRPFAASKDWLKSLSWEVQNTSSKSASYLEIDFDFHELDQSGDRVFKYQYGRGTGAMLLRPSQQTRMTISDGVYVRIKRFVEERQATLTVSIVEMKVAKVVFEDGTAWPPN